MNRLKMVILIVSLTVLAGAYSARSHVFPNRKPSIAYPKTIELGERDHGDIITHEFSIANRGSAMLEIDNVSTTCSCSGLERVVDGVIAPVLAISIPPGEAVPLSVRLAVRGLPGNATRTTLRFRTNDELQPMGQIELLVDRIRGMYFSPAAVVFGATAVKLRKQEVVELRDLAGDHFSVDSIACSDSEHIHAKLLDDEAGPNRATRSLARIEVSVSSATSATIFGDVQVRVGTSKGQKLVCLPVSARFDRPVEVVPSTVYLPRASEKGSIYSVTCLCRSNLGFPLRLVPQQVPDGMAVIAQNGGEEASTQSLRIEWDATDKRAPPGQYVVRLVAHVRDSQYPIEIHVHCRGQEAP